MRPTGILLASHCSVVVVVVIYSLKSGRNNKSQVECACFGFGVVLECSRERFMNLDNFERLF